MTPALIFLKSTYFSIGLGIARRLSREGCRVMLSSRKEANVVAALDDIRREDASADVDGLVCHVAKAEDRRRLVETTVERMGGLDILVSNAAVSPAFGNTLEVREGLNQVYSLGMYL